MEDKCQALLENYATKAVHEDGEICKMIAMSNRTGWQYDVCEINSFKATGKPDEWKFSAKITYASDGNDGHESAALFNSINQTLSGRFTHHPGSDAAIEISVNEVEQD